MARAHVRVTTTTTRKVVWDDLTVEELTLKLNKNSISRAKEYVSQLGTSLSSIVENFFDNLTVNENKSEFPYSPLVNELSGIIHLDEHFDYKSDYTSYLDKKYE